MAKPKKWSEQILMKESLKVQENGKEVETTKNVLKVCVSGLNVFKKHFVEDKWKEQKNMLIVPFDFVVVAGKPCPEGQFYELEYMLGEYGAVYRALIQAVNPCTDLPFIVGYLQYSNILPKEFKARKAWLRDDIDEVHITHAWMDDKDGPCISWGTDCPKPDQRSILDDVLRSNNIGGTFMEYYRGECRELRLNSMREFECPKIMVCGSDNVNDPAFAQQREADMNELREHLLEVKVLLETYNVPHFIFVANDEYADGRINGEVSCNLTAKAMQAMVSEIFKDKE